MSPPAGNVWCIKKYLDTASDRGAVTAMLDALRARGDWHMLATHRRTRPRNAAVTSLFTVKLPLLNHLTFLASATARLLPTAFSRRRRALVVDHNAFFAALPVCLARLVGLSGTRVVLDVRTVPVERHGVVKALAWASFRLAVALANRLASGQTFVSEAMRRYVRPRRRSCVWGSGVDLRLFTRRPGAPPAPLVADRRSVFLYHGALTRSRGLVSLARAFSRLGREDAALVFLGEGEVARELAALGAPVLPPVPYAEVPRYVAHAAFGVLPFPDDVTKRTSNPIKLMEYLALGVPVVLTDIEAHREVVGDAPLAVWAEQTVEGLARALAEALRAQEALTEAARAEGRAIAERYSLDAQAERLARFVDGLA